MIILIISSHIFFPSILTFHYYPFHFLSFYQHLNRQQQYRPPLTQPAVPGACIFGSRKSTQEFTCAGRTTMNEN